MQRVYPSHSAAPPGKPRAPVGRLWYGARDCRSSQWRAQHEKAIIQVWTATKAWLYSAGPCALGLVGRRALFGTPQDTRHRQASHQQPLPGRWAQVASTPWKGCSSQAEGQHALGLSFSCMMPCRCRQLQPLRPHQHLSHK